MQPNNPATAALAAMIKSNPVARYRFDLFKLNFPVTGAILHKIIMARFAKLSGTFDF